MRSFTYAAQVLGSLAQRANATTVPPIQSHRLKFISALWLLLGTGNAEHCTATARVREQLTEHALRAARHIRLPAKTINFLGQFLGLMRHMRQSLQCNDDCGLVLAHLAPFIADADAGLLPQSQLSQLDETFEWLNRCRAYLEVAQRLSMWMARKLKEAAQAITKPCSPVIHIRHRTTSGRRVIRRVQMDSGGDDDEPPEPPIRYCTKALGTDESRGLPPGDGFHRPRTFAPQQDGTPTTTVRPGELP